METKYLYDSYGKEFAKNMEIIKNSGINEEIDKLADLALQLVQKEKFDRTQLEMYISSHLQFEMVYKIIGSSEFTDVTKAKKEDK